MLLLQVAAKGFGSEEVRCLEGDLFIGVAGEVWREGEGA